MQPLVSPVDHESRHNSHRNEDIQEVTITEDTPLLYRFPAVQSSQRNPITTIVVTLLLVILLSGIIIGIYLLVLQSRSENVLPPVEMPLQLVSRAQWDRAGAAPGLLASPRKARQVMVVHTETRQCHSTTSCIELLNHMQNDTAKGETLPYNFLVSSNGQTYEGLGWKRQSPLVPPHGSLALVLAFIGNFTRETPTRVQVDEAKNLIAESVSHQYLEPSYTVFGRNTNSAPTGLWATMEHIPQWSTTLTDRPAD